MEIIIEEISHGHKLLSRNKFNQDTICIGRGYHNDIIVTDPHVCANHICIKYEDENWVVHNENSINGSYLESSNESADLHIIESGDIIKFGKSRIRILFPDHPIAESSAFSPFEGLIEWTRRPLVMAGNIFLFAFIAGCVTYLEKSVEVNFTQVLVPAVTMTLIFACWPSFFAIMSHLTRHDARVMNQFGISFAFFNLVWLCYAIEKMVAFNFSSHWPMASLITLLSVGVIFLLFWLNCYIGFHMKQRQRLIVTTGLTILLFGGTFLVELSRKPDFSARPEYNATIMTPDFMLAPSTTIKDFVSKSERLFTLAQEQVKEN